MTSSFALSTHCLGRRYGRTWALRDCTLSIPTGRTVALVGPNGAGKSTLMNLIVGLLKPTTGSIEILGSRSWQDGSCLARVGYLAQDKPLYQNFKVSEMLTFGRKLNPAWDQRLAEERLSRLNIPLTRKVKELSGGQRTQVALTLAVAKRAELLVLDEPLADLDPLAREEVLDSLAEVADDKGTTVIFSSHIVDDLADTCDWLVVLNRGRIQLSKAIDEVLNEHWRISGPADEVERIAESAEVIDVRHKKRDASLIIRTPTEPRLPEGCQLEPMDLQQLVLSYLRRPELVVADEREPALEGQA